MPMLDAYIPEGGAAPEAEQKLLSRCTDLLLEHEGADPTNEAVRSIAWVFVHRHEMRGRRARQGAALPLRVPGAGGAVRRGSPRRRHKAMTEALVEAEGGRYPNPEARVGVHVRGAGGHLGRVRPRRGLGDIAEFAAGEAGRAYGEQRIADRRREEAQAIVEAAGVGAGAT